MAETRTAARISRLIAQWRTSGESGASFARRHHIPTWTFWYWSRKRSTTSPTVPPTTGPTFVPVQVTGEGDLPVIELVLSGGERVHVRAGAPAELVRAAVRALRSTC